MMIANQWEVSAARLSAFGMAVGVLLLLLLVLGALARDRGRRSGLSFLGQLISGADGRPSTSKWQAAVWTLVAIFGLLEVFIERLLLGISEGDSSIPANLLLAMGFSMTTMAAAKGITVSYVDKGLLNKESAGSAARPGGLITDDSGTPDLSKLQMLAFTAIAVVIYLVRLSLQEPGTPELVDIEPALMVLMGLSQGAYLGKKLTTTVSPRVIGVSPAMAQAGDTIAIIGTSFGDDQNGGGVRLDDVPVLDVRSWTDKRIEFKLPARRAPSLDWSSGDRVMVKVIANGSEVSAPAQLVYGKAG